jgi:hypothetical protein
MFNLFLLILFFSHFNSNFGLNDIDPNNNFQEGNINNNLVNEEIEVENNNQNLNNFQVQEINENLLNINNEVSFVFNCYYPFCNIFHNLNSIPSLPLSSSASSLSSLCSSLSELNIDNDSDNSELIFNPSSNNNLNFNDICPNCFTANCNLNCEIERDLIFSNELNNNNQENNINAPDNE